MTNNDYREKCFSVYERECKACGSTENVEIHHLDGDQYNNDIRNLVPLCSDCHSKVHSARDVSAELSQYQQQLPDESLVFERRNEDVPDKILITLEPTGVVKKEVNANGQVYLGRDLGGKTVRVAYEVVDEED